MKLFNRNNDSSLGISMNDYINSPDNTADNNAGTKPQKVVVSASAEPIRQKQVSYGIQDVIELMQDLPTADPKVIMPIVIKTLESANINVDDIISDAAQQEESIDSRSSNLITQIETLESQVTQMNDEIMAITSELEEISNVKSLLLGSQLKDDKIEDAEEAGLVAELGQLEAELAAHEAEASKLETDADFEDVDIDKAIKDVDKIKVAQKA